MKGLSFTVYKILVGILDAAERFAAALNPPENNTRWTADMARRRVGRQVEIPVTPQKISAIHTLAAERVVEQDAESVRVWHEETWPAIRARAKADNGEVLFGDRVGIRSDQVTGRTWGSRGGLRSPAVPGTGSP
ncbi:DUF6192 family protein [Streptomyces flavovirens]